MKPKVLVALPCGMERTNWLNPELVLTLITMGRDVRFECEFLTIRDFRPFHYARNWAMKVARDGDYQFCVQIDNDQILHTNPLDIIAGAPAEANIIGVRSGLTKGADAVGFFPEQEPRTMFDEVLEVGGSCLIIRNTVWHRIPKGPWFAWATKENSELLECVGGEDQVFCQNARRHGLRVFLHGGPALGHLHTRDVTAIASTMAQAQRPYNVNDLVGGGGARG